MYNSFDLAKYNIVLWEKIIENLSIFQLWTF